MRQRAGWRHAIFSRAISRPRRTAARRQPTSLTSRPSTCRLPGASSAQCSASGETNSSAVRFYTAETAGLSRAEIGRKETVSDCTSTKTNPEIPRNRAPFGGSLPPVSACPGLSGLSGAVEKTRTSTGFRPQRPQRCASTSSATTAHREGPRQPGALAGPGL